MIELVNLAKTYKSAAGDFTAIRNINLTIHDGDVFGIIGLSGAGKSTLVRCINLLERPDQGKVQMDEVDLTALDKKSLREIRRKIGMIFQHFNLMRSRTVYNNIEFALKKSSLSSKEKETKIMSLLELVGLTDKRDAYPSQLSGGQKQRVAIARALVNDPKVLLCDEATSALDPQTTQSILKLLKRVNEELGITIILITHEMAVVKEICDRVAIMENGEVVESGKTIDVFSHPQKQITKDFIDTASNIRKIYDLLEDNHELTQLREGEKMLLLSCAGESVGKPLISHLSKEYDIQVNFIYGNIDYLKGKPLGKLVVTLEGEEDVISKAMEYMKSHGIEMELIK